MDARPLLLTSLALCSLTLVSCAGEKGPVQGTIDKVERAGPGSVSLHLIIQNEGETDTQVRCTVEPRSSGGAQGFTVLTPTIGPGEVVKNSTGTFAPRDPVWESSEAWMLSCEPA